MVENSLVAQATQGSGLQFKQANCGLSGMGTAFPDDPCGCTWIIVEKLIQWFIIMYSIPHVRNTSSHSISASMTMYMLPIGRVMSGLNWQGVILLPSVTSLPLSWGTRMIVTMARMSHQVWKKNYQASSGEITAARDLEMNYNMFWACCRGRSDCYVARCRVEMMVGKEVSGGCEAWIVRIAALTRRYMSLDTQKSVVSWETL